MQRTRFTLTNTHWFQSSGTSAASPQVRQRELLCPVQDCQIPWGLLVLAAGTASSCTAPAKRSIPGDALLWNALLTKLHWKWDGSYVYISIPLSALLDWGLTQLYSRLLEVSRDWLASLYDLGTESLHVSEWGYFPAYNFSHWVLDILGRKDGQ